MKKKTTAGWGRPPAQWMYDLAELKKDDESLFDYEELSEMCGVGIPAIRHIFASLDLPAEFRKADSGAIRRVFRLRYLKREIKAYIKARGYE